MPNILTLDFESYYDVGYGFGSHTTEEYVRDPKFEVIGVSVKQNDQPAVWFSGTHAETHMFLSQYDWANSIGIAHNAMFDMSVLAWRFGIRPKMIADTMSMARSYVGLRTRVSLLHLGRYFKTRRQKGDEVENAKGLRRMDFAPDHLRRYGGYCVNDTEMAYELFMEHLLPHTTQKTMKLIDWTIRAFVEPELELDAELIDLEYRNFLARRDGLLAIAGVSDIKELRSDTRLSELLINLGVVPPQKVSPTTGEITWAFAKSDVEFMDLREHEDERVVAVVEARLGSKTSQVQSRLERFRGIASRGLLPVPLSFAGAIATRRWSGTDQINLQNLPRSKYDKKNLDAKGKPTVILSPLRRAIRARKGRKMAVADLSQIELRVNAWQSGQHDVLDLLRNGGDTYGDMGTTVYGYPVNKKDHPDQRFVGKTAVLGCGYQCGAPKFQHMLKVAARREEIALADDSLDFATRVVKAYREKNDKIVRNWYAWNDAIEAIAWGGVREIGPYRVRDQKIFLPDGSHLYYPELALQEKTGKDEIGTEWTYSRIRGRATVRTKIYGGKVVENITQAVAWLFISDALLRLREIKYQNGEPVFKVVNSVHDELVVTFEEGLDENWVRGALSWAMTTAPEWAPNIPLAFEGEIGFNYAECK